MGKNRQVSAPTPPFKCCAARKRSTNWACNIAIKKAPSRVWTKSAHVHCISSLLDMWIPLLQLHLWLHQCEFDMNNQLIFSSYKWKSTSLIKLLKNWLRGPGWIFKLMTSRSNYLVSKYELLHRNLSLKYAPWIDALKLHVQVQAAEPDGCQMICEMTALKQQVECVPVHWVTPHCVKMLSLQVRMPNKLSHWILCSLSSLRSKVDVALVCSHFQVVLKALHPGLWATSCQSLL